MFFVVHRLPVVTWSSYCHHGNCHLVRHTGRSISTLTLPECLDLFVCVESFWTWGDCACPPYFPPTSLVVRIRPTGILSVGRRRRDRTPNLTFPFLFFISFSFSNFFFPRVCTFDLCCRSRAGSLLSTLWSSSNNRIEITGSGVSDRKNWSESLPFRKNKKFLLFFLFFFLSFPCLYFYMCGDACDGNHSVCFRLLPVELWLWIVSVRSWLPSAFCFLSPAACCMCQAKCRRKKKTNIFKIVHAFWRTDDWFFTRFSVADTFFVFFFLYFSCRELIQHGWGKCW